MWPFSINSVTKLIAGSALSFIQKFPRRNFCDYVLSMNFKSKRIYNVHKCKTIYFRNFLFYISNSHIYTHYVLPIFWWTMHIDRRIYILSISHLVASTFKIQISSNTHSNNFLSSWKNGIRPRKELNKALLIVWKTSNSSYYIVIQ